MKKILVIAALVLAAAPAAFAGGPRVELGSVLDEALQAAKVRVTLAQDSALSSAYRFSVTWASGETTVPAETLVALPNAVTAAQATRGDVYVLAYPYGSSQTPISDADQQQFAGWLTARWRSG